MYLGNLSFIKVFFKAPWPSISRYNDLDFFFGMEGHGVQNDFGAHWDMESQGVQMVLEHIGILYLVWFLSAAVVIVVNSDDVACALVHGRKKGVPQNLNFLTFDFCGLGFWKKISATFSYQFFMFKIKSKLDECCFGWSDACGV